MSCAIAIQLPTAGNPGPQSPKKSMFVCWKEMRNKNLFYWTWYRNIVFSIVYD